MELNRLSGRPFISSSIPPLSGWIGRQRRMNALCSMLPNSLYIRNCKKPRQVSLHPFPSLVTITNRTSSLIPSVLATETAAQRQLLSSEAEPEASTQLLPRRLILLRHAKSSWADPSLHDHDRPLSKAGRADAIKVAHKLKDLGWIPEIILLSDAARTRETLRIMQEQVTSFSEAQVHYISSFYSIAAMDGQTADHLQKVICEYSRDGILTVMCMGHNRGWEEAASMFTGALIELKTCNAALLEASGRTWEEAFSLAGLGGWKLHGIVKPAS